MSSFILKSSVVEAQTAKSFNFSDLTGLYNSVTNIGGWGSPNPIIANVTIDELQITFPDPVTLLPTGFTYTIDLKALGFPTTDTTYFTTILSTTIGAGYALFPDGAYYFNRTVEGILPSPFEYHWQTYKIFAAQTNCCVNKLDMKASTSCGCNEGINQAIMDKMLYQNALCASAKCGDIGASIRFLKALMTICSQNNCNC